MARMVVAGDLHEDGRLGPGIETRIQRYEHEDEYRDDTHGVG
jgi:hypothetical protein